MADEKKYMSSNIALMGCFLALVLLSLSMFLSGAVLSRRGIGIIGNVKEATGSPVGAWKGSVNGSVMRINPDGTGMLLRDGREEYFEWRLAGNELAIFQFAKPQSVRASIHRTLRGLGLQGERGHSNFKLVEVTSDKLMLALDDELHHKSGYQLGDHIEYESLSKESEQNTISDRLGK